MSQETESTLTKAQKIWNEIKDKPVEMFSLPAAPLHKYANMVPIEPSKLYLTYNASALYPTLESTLGSKYKLEMADKYLVVSYA